MRNLRTRLPPVNALVAFEAAARHLSFTGAGAELGVSREAVSRHIRLLEAHVGATLFTRVHRAVELTPEGARFVTVVRRCLDEIARAAEALGRGDRGPRVSVTATVAIASFWLTPRLPRFRKLHPDVEITVAVADQPRDMVAEGIDVGLRYGDGKWPGLVSRELFRTETCPVCSPNYLDEAPPLAHAGDLANHVLLNLTGGRHAHEDWRWWLDGLGLDHKGRRMLVFDNYANVIQAALEGQGVALGFAPIIDGLLRDGRLVRPIPETLSRGLAVHVVTPQGTTLTEPAKAFRDWVVAEASA
jgi:LysR family glycine cleavage system transcriptional activator